MKALWITLAVLAALGLACCGGVFFLGKGVFNAVAETNDAADKYSAQIFPEIARRFDTQTIAKYASPDLQQELSGGGLAGKFKKYHDSLGTFKSIGEFTASNTQANTNNGNSVVRVTTSAIATFEKGTPRVTLTVIKRGEDWKLQEIEVGAPTK